MELLNNLQNKMEIIRTETEKFENRFERIKTLIEGLFVDESHNQNNIQVKQIDENLLRIKATIKPNKMEEKNFENDFSIEINMDANIVSWCDDTNESEGKSPFIVIGCYKMRFKMEQKEVRLKDICPIGIRLYFQSDCPGPQYSHDDKFPHIIIPKICSISDFIGLLHEIGHAVDYYKRNIKGQKDEFEYEKKQGIGGTERNAWAEALKIAKKFNLPMMDLIRAEAQKSLESYQKYFHAENVTNRERGRARRFLSKLKETKITD